jgi:hypothetical protein
MTLLRCMDWLELEGAVVTPRIYEHFCEGIVFMRGDKFEVVCVPRFREIFNASAKHADMLRTCGEPSMVRLAAQFDAENSARAAADAIDSILSKAQG